MTELSWIVGGECGWLVGWLAGWLVGWLAGWLVDWLSEPSKPKAKAKACARSSANGDSSRLAAAQRQRGRESVAGRGWLAGWQGWREGKGRGDSYSTVQHSTVQ